jgi:hypothetical protein
MVCSYPSYTRAVLRGVCKVLHRMQMDNGSLLLMNPGSLATIDHYRDMDYMCSKFEWAWRLTKKLIDTY